jgi:2-polyprenyl-6-methoxyphenol hydroxylase-like FAD-dependent oxidoreductase
MTKTREKVIIVGGGPVGLLCALNLASHDVPVLVLESHPELFMDLRAGSFHPPTLEVMEPLGVTAKLLEIGIPVHKWQLRDRQKGVIGTFELSLLADETPFPFRLHLEQHRFTPLVLEELRKLPNTEVRFSCHVENITQTGSGIRVTARTTDGAEEFDGTWVIGADGGGSVVRKCADIDFEGFTFPERFALISTTHDLGRHGFTDTAYISHPVEWCAVFRLPDQGPPGLWRFLYGCDPNESEQVALSGPTIEKRLQSVQPKSTPYDVVHRTIYRVHQRVATTFRNGRFLIAGDAAHLNNPIGGFGLNCGLQDAMNLTDKLIRVVHAEASDDLLDLYVRQRRTANIEYVQEASIRNKRLLEETDESVRIARLDDMRRASLDPSLAKAVLMRSSMIESMRRANSIV